MNRTPKYRDNFVLSYNMKEGVPEKHATSTTMTSVHSRTMSCLQHVPSLSKQSICTKEDLTNFLRKEVEKWSIRFPPIKALHFWPSLHSCMQSVSCSDCRRIDRFYGSVAHVIYACQEHDISRAVAELRCILCKSLHAWRSDRRLGSETASSFLCMVTNGLSLLQIKDSFMQGRHKQKWACKVSRGIAPSVRSILQCRVCSHSNDVFLCLSSFIDLQVRSVWSADDHESQIIYQLFTREAYIGRTALKRLRKQNVSGFTARWSEHERDFFRQLQGEQTPSRIRNRYRVSHSDQQLFLNYISLSIVSKKDAPQKEGAYILLVLPKANNIDQTPGCQVSRRRRLVPRADRPRLRSRPCKTRDAIDFEAAKNKDNFFEQLLSAHESNVKDKLEQLKKLDRLQAFLFLSFNKTYDQEVERCKEGPLNVCDPKHKWLLMS